FIPLMFMGGVIGRLFREFAVTISVAILVSGFVALTLTPMLCSRLLKAKHHHEEHGRFFTATERAFQALLNGYERSLGWVMRHRVVTLVFSAAILAATALLFTNIPKGLFPPDDTGSLNMTAEAAQGTTFVEMLRFRKLVSDRLDADTNVASYTTNAGGGMGASSNQVGVNITLKPAGQRPPADEMVHELTDRMRGIQGLQVFVTNPPSIRIGGRGSKTAYQYTLRGPDITQLYDQAGKLLTRLQDDPML